MPTRQSQAPGGRQIRHVVKVTPEQEQALQARANSRNWTVARLLVESALNAPPDNSTLLLQSVNGLRKLLLEHDLERFEESLAELLKT